MAYLRIETARFDPARDDALFGESINAEINPQLAGTGLRYAFASRDKTTSRVVVVGVFETREQADAGFPLSQATRERLGAAGFEPDQAEVLEIGNQFVAAPEEALR